MENIPAHDVALATRFRSYYAAHQVAVRCCTDDTEWSYSIRAMSDGSYLLVVYDSLDDDAEFLGYL